MPDEHHRHEHQEPEQRGLAQKSDEGRHLSSVQNNTHDA
jgi:hypothetical protein